MSKRHSERLARQYTKGMLDFSASERCIEAIARRGELRAVNRVLDRILKEPTSKRPQISISKARREAIRQMAGWLTRSSNNALYKALVEGVTGPINLQSIATRDVYKGPSKG